MLNSTRIELAKHYLENATLTLTEIAFLLGYQEQSSFSHAFREWTGINPAAWRQQRAEAATSLRPE
ncbi:MAG: helix-turn-helix domain-containing protein [Burkholderiales bacterium]|nr:helix-turn-helix domain-containing protein [Burkholderiales bacterium]